MNYRLEVFTGPFWRTRARLEPPLMHPEPGGTAGTIKILSPSPKSSVGGRNRSPNGTAYYSEYETRYPKLPAKTRAPADDRRYY